MILLVDDEQLNRKLLQWSLAKAGHEFVHAVNGLDAIEKVKGHDVEIILLDLMMPEMDGFGFLEWRNQAGRAILDIPVIVNSALSDMESIKRALNMGAYDYFAKPLSSDDLEVLLPTKVRNAIESSRALRAIRRHSEAMDAELRAAERLQTSLLPDRNAFAPLRFDYVYRPCSGVGGDFFDVLKVDDHRVAMLVGDVTGHGLKAGMMSFMVKSLFRDLAAREPAPSAVISSLNRTLCQVFESGHYMTGVYVLFDFAASTCTLANLGHPPPLLAEAGRSLDILEGGGNFLGMFEDPIIEIVEKPWTPGASLFVYTDGVTEAEDASGAPLQSEGLLDIVSHADSPAPDRWCALIEDAVSKRRPSGEFDDDVLLVACWCEA